MSVGKSDAIKVARTVSGTYEARDFRLTGGGLLPKVRAAHLQMGELNADRSNVILINHGYTSSHTFIQDGSAASEGSWSELVGPGKAIDTDRFFIVSSNALGSCYGATGPGSIDPATGRTYGSTFPAISFEDIVRLQKQLLESLGVTHLHAVVGVSLGGYQTLQWGVQYPDLMDRLVVVHSALKSPFANIGATDTLKEALHADPHWNGGFPAARAMLPTLTTLRVATLTLYGMHAYLAEQGFDDAMCALRIAEMASKWAEGFDANSLLTLRNASSQFDVTEACGRIRAQLLLVLCTTDRMFPASKGAELLAHLKSKGVEATFVELQSKYGHLASGLDWQQWAGPLRQFLDA